MSNYGAPPSQFDDAEIERQLQEEFRRRQQAMGVQGAGGGAALPSRGQQRPPDAYSQHQINMIQHQAEAAAAAANSPYGYAHSGAPGQHHASPYTRVTNPYGGLADARSAYSQGHGGANATPQGATSDTVAQLYAAQQRRAQIAGSYGYQAGPAASRAALEQHYAAYGMTGTPAPYSHEYGHDGSYQGQSSHDAAMQQQQMQDAYARSAPNSAANYPPQRSPTEGEGSGDAHTADTPAGNGNAKKGKAPKSNGGKNKESKKKNPMLQKVTSTFSKTKTTARVVVKDGVTIIEDGSLTWYTGCVPLGVEDDKYWLSELQVYLRANFAEAFGATEDDIAAPMHGRNKPIALGQVGIRCLHCKSTYQCGDFVIAFAPYILPHQINTVFLFWWIAEDNPAERGQQATSYPSLISGIYNSVQQMLRLHLDCCLSMPPEVRSKIEALKVSCSSRGGRKQYWVDSAKRLGLVDTPHGIHFGRDPLGPLPPLSGPSVNSKEGRVKKRNPPKPPPPPKSVDPDPELDDDLAPPPPPVDTRPLVFPDDEALISDYLYLTLEQMSPCLLMEADRVGCYKTRKVGFPGLSCRHCVGQAGCGRYFPASEASLSQTTTSQTIMNHVRNCRRCPIEIRENLEIMKRNRMGPDGKRSDKPKHGGRKVFFHRLWCRIQGIPFDDAVCEVREKKKRKYKRPGPKRKKRKTEDGSGDDSANEDNSSDEESETDSEDEGTDRSEDGLDTKPKAKRGGASPGNKMKISPWVDGCVRLTKTDDPHWLSEMECFARSDLIEVFNVKDDDLQMFSGRKAPAAGQVGVRCIFCKTLDPSDRPNHCVAFPDSLSSLHIKVTDMIRLHFPNCSSMPDDAKATYKSHKGFDAKVANDDSQQYWVDSARDIGLSNIPPEGPDVPGAWGITFRRDPLEPSPADDLDWEQTNGAPGDFGKNSMVLEEDRGECTDQVMLLLRQVRPCRFKKSDRRAGPGSRGRDRSMGFPGLCCKHCAGRNTLGRYFPVSAKNLTDSTTNSMQAHLATCTHCPEPIKASLAYLSHRSILQKAELSGSWKKTFFKKIWDRLHVDRGWTSIDDEDGAEKGEFSSAEEEDMAAEGDDDDGGEHDENEGDKDGEEDDEEGEEGSGTQMNALIKAAAIWLTNQDAATDGKGGARSAKGRPLPGKRGAAAAAEKPEADAAASGGSASKESPKKRKGRK